MTNQIIENLGPLRPLVGIWEGGTGDDTAPSDDRGVEKNPYRERTLFEPFGPTANHEQVLYGLKYATQAWRIGEADPFHDEVGYLIWDAKAGQVMKGILVPRGVSVLAGGFAKADSRKIKLKAELGSKTFGICSNPFLDREFQTVGFDLEMDLSVDGVYRYDQSTKIQIKGQKAIFDHRDCNTLKRIV